jgi:hypothetical protein
VKGTHCLNVPPDHVAYADNFQVRAKKCRFPCNRKHNWNGKREYHAVNAVYDDDSSVSRRIFVTDKRTKTSFLVDMGADVCMYPRSKLHGPSRRNDDELFAVNGTPIATAQSCCTGICLFDELSSGVS